MAPLKHREGPLPGGERLGKRSHFNWWPEEPSGTALKTVAERASAARNPHDKSIGWRLRELHNSSPHVGCPLGHRALC